MNIFLILYTLGSYFIFFALCFLPSFFLSMGEGEWQMTEIFGGIAGATLLLGLGLFFFGRSRSREGHYTKKEGLLVVALIWIGSGIIGGLPFYFSGYITQIISAIFESVSGFTTTGSSVLTDIEALPQSLLFWRSFTHYLGGLGVVVLFVAILPFLGVGGRVLFETETSGPETDSLKPKVRETAMVLLKIYLAFTIVETLLLFCFGMTFFDAICHTFATLATGGFSTKNASIAYYHSLEIELTIVFFMMLAGVNFSLYFFFLKKKKGVFWGNTEFKAYLASIFIATLLITIHLTLYFRPDFWLNLRESLFEVVSLHTATGFGLADYEKWTSFSKLLLVLLMIMGGSAGSTAGGIKVVRMVIIVKYIKSRIVQLFHPHAVVPVKMGGKPVDEAVVKGVIGLFCLWMLILALGSLVLTSMGLDIETATTACVTTLSGVGPGLGMVGPTDNFSVIPQAGQLVLIICMLFGRLEIYTLLIIFLPSFWKK